MRNRIDYRRSLRSLLPFFPFIPVIIVAALFLYPRLNEFFGDNLVHGALRAGRILAIRLPPSQEETWIVMLYSDQPFEGPGFAIQGLENTFGDEMQKRELSSETWAAVNILREGWCQSTPAFETETVNTLYYDVSFRCKDMFGIYAKMVAIPVDQLPVELHKVLRLFE
jgi:hypothetical protein